MYTSGIKRIATRVCCIQVTSVLSYFTQLFCCVAFLLLLGKHDLFILSGFDKTSGSYATLRAGLSGGVTATDEVDWRS